MEKVNIAKKNPKHFNTQMNEKLYGEFDVLNLFTKLTTP